LGVIYAAAAEKQMKLDCATNVRAVQSSFVCLSAAASDMTRIVIQYAYKFIDKNFKIRKHP